MQKALLLIISFTVVFFGCGKHSEKVPDGILSKEEMIPVMVDIQIAEAGLVIKNFQGDSAKQYATDYYNYIYSTHHVTKEVFNKSLDYYLKHPKEMDEIYTEVITELSKKEALEGS